MHMRPKRPPLRLPPAPRLKPTPALELLLGMLAAPRKPPQLLGAFLFGKTKRPGYRLPNGRRECERRSRQVAAGRLKKENGLA